MPTDLIGLTQDNLAPAKEDVSTPPVSQDAKVIFADASVPDMETGNRDIQDTIKPYYDAINTETASPTDTAQPLALPKFVIKTSESEPPKFMASLAHLYGGTVGGVPLHAIPNIDVFNPGAGTDAIVTAQIQMYAQPASTRLFLIEKSITRTVPIYNTYNFEALYSISTPLIANATLELRQAGSSALIDSRTRPIRIMPKNAMYWTMPGENGQMINTTHFIGVFVTPHDKQGAINLLLKEAVSFSKYGAMIGYQYPPDEIKALPWSPSSQMVEPGNCNIIPATANAATELQLQVQVTCSLCLSSNASFQVFTETDWSGNKLSPLLDLQGLGSWNGSI